MSIPIRRVKANPLTKLDVKKYRTSAVRIVLTFESLMEDQANRKPDSMAESPFAPWRVSSFALSKIRIFASRAAPIESINPVMPERLMVNPGVSLKIASENMTYRSSEIHAIIPRFL
jgi:hypothetical protein